MNTNAASGKEVERLFRDSIAKQPDVLELLRSTYNIKGVFSTTMLTGTGQKCDVKIGFDCGRNIDASIKAYKISAGANQLTRLTVDNFAQKFNLSEDIRETLRSLIIEKSRVSNPRRVTLFPENKQEMFKEVFDPLLPDIIKQSFSDVPGREILVLYSKDERIMRIWRMKDVIDRIPKSLSYTPQGNMLIGGCIGLQRKGGNGKRFASLPKTSPSHPANQIQIKLLIKKFINLHRQRMLVEYEV